MIGRVGDGMQGLVSANARWVAFGTGALRALPAAGPAPAHHPCWGFVILCEIGDQGSWEPGGFVPGDWSSGRELISGGTGRDWAARGGIGPRWRWPAWAAAYYVRRK